MVHILHAWKVNSKTNTLLGIFIGHKMVLVPVKNAKTNINLHRKNCKLYMLPKLMMLTENNKHVVVLDGIGDF